jgi:hypothetical protein
MPETVPSALLQLLDVLLEFEKMYVLSFDTTLQSLVLLRLIIRRFARVLEDSKR